MDNSELITSMVALGGVPLILGLVQLFKRSGRRRPVLDRLNL